MSTQENTEKICLVRVLCSKNSSTMTVTRNLSFVLLAWPSTRVCACVGEGGKQRV